MSDATLHILNRGPADRELLQHCLDSFSPGDALMLIEDAVYWSLPTYQSLISDLDVYALEPDLQARGVSPTHGIKPANDAQFVELCVQFSKSLSWC